MIRFPVPLLALFCSASTLCAEEKQSGDFKYTSDGSAITITGYTGKDGEVTIPEEIAGLPVKKIKNIMTSREEQPTLTSIIIPVSITEIGYKGWGIIAYPSSLQSINVLEGNSAYSSIDGILFNADKTKLIRYPAAKKGDYAIPDGVTAIASGAFGHCEGLTHVRIPASVTSIGWDMPPSFAGCTALRGFDVAADNPKYRSVDGVLFDSDQTALIQYPGGKAGICTIPASVTGIGEIALAHCVGLSGIEVEEGNPRFHSVDGVLFRNYEIRGEKCVALVKYPEGKPGSNYTIPDGIIHIDSSVIGDGFYNCKELTSVTIPASVDSVSNTFSGCTSLASATFKGNVPKYFGGAFADASPNFTIRYYKGAAGFTTPEWNGYKTVEIDPVTELFDWTSNDGKTLKASFVKLDGEVVVVRMEDGKEHKIPFTRLSPSSVAQAKMFGGGSK